MLLPRVITALLAFGVQLRSLCACSLICTNHVSTANKVVAIQEISRNFCKSHCRSPSMKGIKKIMLSVMAYWSVFLLFPLTVIWRTEVPRADRYSVSPSMYRRMKRNPVRNNMYRTGKDEEAHWHLIVYMKNPIWIKFCCASFLQVQEMHWFGLQ